MKMERTALRVRKRSRRHYRQWFLVWVGHGGCRWTSVVENPSSFEGSEVVAKVKALTRTGAILSFYDVHMQKLKSPSLGLTGRNIDLGYATRDECAFL